MKRPGNKKETVIQMKTRLFWRCFFEISEMTNIKNLFSQAKQIRLLEKTKKINGRKN
jgi:hypothetical protein